MICKSCKLNDKCACATCSKVSKCSIGASWCVINGAMQASNCGSYVSGILEEVSIIDKVKVLREMIWDADIPHPTVPEYVELHEKMQKFLKYIDEEMLGVK